MLYQLLTGDVPFTADSALGILTKHLTETVVPPRRRRPDWQIPASLEQVCLKAMQKRKELRYASASEMSDALLAALEDMGDAAASPMGARRRESAPLEHRTPAGNGAAVEPRSRPTRWPLVAAAAGIAVIALAVALSQANRSSGSANAPGPWADDPAGRDRTPARAPVGARARVDAGGGDPDANVPRDGAGEPEPAVASGSTTKRRPVLQPRGGEGSPPAEAVPLAERPEPEAESPGQAAYDEGRRRLMNDDVRGAIDKLREAAGHMPANALVQRELGRALMRAGDHAHASAAYRRYLELAPDAPDRAVIERIVRP
jgi:serine/threonine-protein kinase